MPFGFSAHARDVRKIEAAALSRQARLAACVVACNAEVAGVLQAAGAHVDHVPHGVDASRFRPGHRMRNGRLEILAVGRLVEKKGFEVLVDATRRLTSPFRLRIIGDGGLRDRLESAIGVDHRSRRHQVGRIELCSPRTHAELPDVYASSDVVVVPSVIDATGDRDGLPNVVLEAMASGVAVVGSDVAAIATAVVDGETGFLVPPGDPVALASRLEVLARDPHLTARLGRTGRERVEADFPLEGCIDRLCRVMRDAYG